MDNFFDFFEIPVAFFPDENLLKQKYYTNSRLFHPDFYTLEDEKVQEQMLEKSSLNNKAYATLSSLENRIPYILSLFVDMSKEKTLDPNFLMEMMDFNETWETAVEENDVTTIQSLKEKCLHMLRTLDDEIRPVMLDFDQEGPGQSILEEIKDYYYKRKYILRIQENISTFAGL
jgi:molecular chaperone HscB